MSGSAQGRSAESASAPSRFAGRGEQPPRRARPRLRRAFADRAARRPSWMRPISGGSAARSAGPARPGHVRCRARSQGPRARAAAARRRRPSRSRGRAAPRGRSPPQGAALARAQLVLVDVEHRQHGNLAACAGRIAVEGTASPRARRARACRSAVPGRADAIARAAIASARPISRPACGPPSSLSPEQQTSAAPAAIDASAAARRRARRGRRSVRRRGEHARSRRRRSRARRARTALRSARPRRTRPLGSSKGGRGGSRQRGAPRSRARAR